MCGEACGRRLTLEKRLRSSDRIHDSPAPEDEAETSTLARVKNIVVVHAHLGFQGIPSVGAGLLVWVGQ